ncbi:MAG: hypothetical protein DBY17_06445 [Oscillospiraceae bacterium]|nr:MAG: hypothetical protein DBY17_06445 [Oscillospiraceae bacterium]
MCGGQLWAKPVPAARALLPGASRQAPYPGAKKMLRAGGADDAAFPHRAFHAIWDEPPAPKPPVKKKKE